MSKLCDECETVAHCLKHGCIPKQSALDKKAENARELGLDYEPAQQEPVAWWIPKAKQFCLPSSDGTRPFAKAWEPLYTSAPAQRIWVGLTDEEVKQLCLAVGTEPIEVRLIEAKLKEKNT